MVHDPAPAEIPTSPEVSKNALGEALLERARNEPDLAGLRPANVPDKQP
jgi:hypothetical protein